MNFSQKQTYSLLNKMGYTGPEDPKMMEAFMASNPRAAATMGKFDRVLKKKAGMASGGQVAPNTNNTPAGFDADAYLKANPDVANSSFASNPLEHYQLHGKAEGRSLGSSSTPQKTTQKATLAPPALAGLGPQGGPQGLVASFTPQKMDPNVGMIDPSVGQLAPLKKVTASTAKAVKAETPEKVEAETITAQEVTDKITDAVSGIEAVTADPSKEATVRGQLELLMEDFEGGQTPPWASGAMRNAMGLMQRRGLGASSIAGQAVVQAAMESALPIAAADAQTTAQFEMQNLNNRQQTAIFKTQQKIAGILSDQAAVNAAEQFNAASENQTNQFFANLESTVARFNADQINAISQFNAKEKNAVKMFNSQLQAQRDQFNAANSLVVAQANAKWRQDTNTLNTSAQNESTMNTVKQTNRLTEAGLNNMWQRERDMMNFAFQSSENAQERALTTLLADKELDAVRDRIDAENDRMFGAGLASLASDLFSWG